MLLLLMLTLLPPQSTDTSDPTREKQVVVIGTRHESDVLDVPSGVTVLTRQQIEESGATNIKEVLQRTPGIFVQGSNPGAYDAILDLRGYNNGGGNGQRTLVLIDGRRTNSVNGSITDWGTIPLDDVERIEIVRGPAAALYGDPALAGVIQIFTRSGSRKETRRLHAATGTWNTSELAATVVEHIDKTDLDVNAQLSRNSTDGYRDNSAFDATDFAISLSNRPALGWHSRIRLAYHEDERERPDTLSRANIAVMSRRASTAVGDRASRNDVDLNLLLQNSPATDREFSAQITTLHGHQDSNFGTFETHDEYEQSAIYLKKVAPFDPVTLTAGADLVYEEANSLSGTTSNTDADYVRRMVGVYAHAETDAILPELLLSGSLRFDRALLSLDRDIPPGGFGTSFDTQRDFDQWSPSLGATYSLGDDLSLYASYGRPFKYPTRDELNGFTASDPQLHPERAHSYEVGTRLASHSTSASLAYFRMDVDEEIFYDSINFTNLNFDEVRHQGVESDFRISTRDSHWLPDFDLFGVYTLTRAIVQSGSLEGKWYPVTPKHSANAGLTVMLPRDSFVTLSARYVGSRFLINDVGNTGETLPGYAVYDAKIVRPVAEQATVSLSVLNLGDREYYDSGGSTFSGPEFNPAAGRSYLLSLEATF